MTSINDKYEKIKEQCRIRQNRFYNKNRETILAGRKLEFKLLEIIICLIVFIDPVTSIFLFIAEINGEFIPFFVGKSLSSILLVFM